MLRVGAHYLEPRRIGYFLVEAALLWLAFVLAAELVWACTGHAPGQLAPLAAWAAWGLGATLAVEVGLYLGDLHDVRTALGDALHGRRIHRAIGIGALLLAAALALDGSGPRVPSLVAGLGAAGFVALTLRAQLPVVGRWIGLRTRVFLLGDGRAARTLVREITRDGGVEVVGFCGPRTPQLVERVKQAGATTVVVATDDRRGLPTLELLHCRAEGLDVIDAATLATRALHRLPVELLRPSDLIFSDGFSQPRGLTLLRRLLSLTAAIVLLALVWPVLLVVALLVKRDGGPVLYRQERVGRGGAPFQMIKFRTMRVDAEKNGVKWAEKDDPRVTRVGRILRRFRIDELPQLWNVLKGEMELVGPRPERPQFVDDLRKRIPFYDLRHVVPPGITGYAQVCYPYAASLEEAKEKLQYDLYYVRHLSLALDLYVLLMTARVVLFGRGAR